MGRQAWTVHAEDRAHRIEVEYGYWFGAVTMRLDGSVVLRSRPLLDMSYDRGIDLPISVDGHSLIVAIRPTFWRRTLLVTGYRYALARASSRLRQQMPIRRAASGRR